MRVSRQLVGARQRGMVLIASLLLLLVVTLLAMAMFRSMGIDARSPAMCVRSSARCTPPRAPSSTRNGG